jgi:hypothetical protein
MYVRFIVLAPRRRRPFGLFRAETELLEDPTLPAWLRDPIDEHLRWFTANLRLPFRRRPKRRRIQATAICWFRPEAHAHIARAHDLAWLISEAGHPTAIIKTSRVGQIIYRDEAQIVAKPDPTTRLRA